MGKLAGENKRPEGIRQGTQGKSEEENEEDEIETQIRKLKKKKAAGIDGIPSEAWIYSAGNTREKLYLRSGRKAW